MAKDAKILCPLMGSECVEDGSVKDGELVKCRFWVNVMGQNPQTGETVNNGDCSFAWLPVLMIENSKVNRETGAAIERVKAGPLPRLCRTAALASVHQGDLCRVAECTA